MSVVKQPTREKPKPTDTTKQDDGDDTPAATNGRLLAALHGLSFIHDYYRDEARRAVHTLWKGKGIDNADRDHLLAYLSVRHRTTVQEEQAAFDALEKA